MAERRAPGRSSEHRKIPLRVIVVGADIAGLMVIVRLCERGIPVRWLVEADPSHAITSFSSDGINAALDSRSTAETENDSAFAHFEDTIRCGEFLAHQPPVRAMTEAAGELVERLAWMGVPLERTRGGGLHQERLAGSRAPRTFHAGATTDQQVRRALLEQVRRFETEDWADRYGARVTGEKLVERLVGWELLSLVQDDDHTTVGVVAQNVVDMTIRPFRADAVCLATAGASELFHGRSFGCSSATASSIAFQQGALYANAEFIQFHPTALLTARRPLLLPESLRAAGARLWVPRKSEDTRAARDIPERERDHFAERLFPDTGNLTRRDWLAQEMFRLGLRQQGDGSSLRFPGTVPCVYLDLTHLKATHWQAFTPLLSLIRRRAGVDPVSEPLRVGPVAHYSMGGLWVDYETNGEGRLIVDSPRNHATSLLGLYAVGECDYQYHGANLLGGNALLSSLFAGHLAAEAMRTYLQERKGSAKDLPASLFEKAEDRERQRYTEVLGRAESAEPAANPHRLYDELRTALAHGCGVERAHDELTELDAQLEALQAKAQQADPLDRGSAYNESARCARALEAHLVLARLIAKSALRRAESRGAHGVLGSVTSSARVRRVKEDQGPPRCSLSRYANGAFEFVDRADYPSPAGNLTVEDTVDATLIAPRASSGAAHVASDLENGDRHE